MTLYEYLINCDEEEEITVWDIDYDMMCYFYNNSPDDVWQTMMLELAKLLPVVRHNNRSVEVDFTGLIQRSLATLEQKELFSKCTVDSIMGSMQGILSEYVAAEWFIRFVNALKTKST